MSYLSEKGLCIVFICYWLWRIMLLRRNKWLWNTSKRLLEAHSLLLVESLEIVLYITWIWFKCREFTISKGILSSESWDWLRRMAYLSISLSFNVILFFHNAQIFFKRILVIDLLKACETWPFWSTTTITSLQVGPKAFSSWIFADLCISLLGKSGTFPKSLWVGQISL